MLLQRGLERAFSEFVDVVPVTILEGGRAVGKSTLCRVVGDQRGWPAPLDLAEPQRRAQLLLDPIRFLSDLRHRRSSTKPSSNPSSHSG